MEADDMGGGDASMMMDVEQEDTTSSSTIHNPIALNLHQNQGFAGMNVNVPEGFQQHCLLPQFPQNTSTPITWTR